MWYIEVMGQRHEYPTFDEANAAFLMANRMKKQFGGIVKGPFEDKTDLKENDMKKRNKIST